jgi:hypothetical protein
MKLRGRSIVALAALLVGLLPSTLVATVAVDDVWRDVDERTLQFSGERLIVPRKYRVLALDLPELSARFSMAPREGTSGANLVESFISLPLPDGGTGRFRLEESPIMAPELRAKFPEIRTFRAFGVDDFTAYARLDLTPQGFHGMILSAGETVYIDPYARGTSRYYISYFKSDHRRSTAPDWSCSFSEANGLPGEELVPGLSGARSPEPAIANGSELRTYRLAVAATVEYTAFHGGTVAAGMAAIATAMNRVNAIYERDVAIRMTLVANNDLIVYDSNPDPYSNNSGLAMLAQNQANLDAVIGNANYDIGHVFSTGGGGVASLGVPCVTGFKARGVTGLGSPIGDPFYVDYVAHEMGHQWGATHTFNGNEGSCSGGNRTEATAYEPGSGSTIMAYAGICGSQNLQSNSDDHFHVASYDQIRTYSRAGGGDLCDVSTPIGNTAPTPVMPDTSGVTIPTGTPFELCGSATDPNHAGLTYDWEEYDLGPAGAPGAPVGQAPIFRSFSPSASPCRVFPKQSDLLGNTSTIGELLPTYGRNLNFRMTVRDNMANGGGVDYGQVAFTVDGGSGPFLVTSPNTSVSWTGLVSETVTWDPAGTNLYCSDVDILFSEDWGASFPTTLLATTPNDGSATVVPPNILTSGARVKVACSDNIFFDLSDLDFTVVKNGVPSAAITTPSEGALFSSVDTISFSGTATDPEDGNRTASLDWSSNIGGGSFGTGGSPSTSSLGAGYHTIRATATDTAGQTGSDTVHLVIEALPGCPASEVIATDPPAGSSTYFAVDTVTVDSGVTVSAASDVVIRAGRSVRFNTDVAVAGPFVVENTPTPCP